MCLGPPTLMAVSERVERGDVDRPLMSVGRHQLLEPGIVAEHGLEFLGVEDERPFHLGQRCEQGVSHGCCARYVLRELLTQFGISSVGMAPELLVTFVTW